MQKIKAPLVAVGLIFFTVATLGGLTACSKKSEAPAQENLYFTRGDPMNLLYGTKRNRRVPLKDFRDTKKLYLTNRVRFEQKVESADIPGPLNIEKGNEPTKREDFNPVFEEFTVGIEENMLVIANDNWSLVITDNGAGEPGSASIIVDHREHYSWNLQHYSVSPDGENISITLNFEDDQDPYRSVVIYYFSRSPDIKQAETTDKNYYYLMGVGRKFRWDKNSTVTLDICGPYAEELKPEIETAVREWQEVLGENLTLKINTPESYAPLSDLNQKCFYVINDFIYKASNRISTTGVTYTSYDYKNGKLLDSDILLFTREYEKNPKKESMLSKSRKPLVLSTIIHEMGHFLGLHHQFDKDEHRQNVASVMSYTEDNFLTLQPYDIEALQCLYE